MKEKFNKGKLFILIFRLISIFIILICLCFLLRWHIDNKNNTTIQQELSKFTSTENTETGNIESLYSDILDDNGIPISNFTVDFNSLTENNSDCIGWIRINGTNISYPIVQTIDNDFYLTHNINKEKNGAGSIFADYRNNFDILDQNTIIYGHNRRNGSMFSNLKYYLDTEFCSNKNYQYFNFYTVKQKYLAEIFSIYKITSEKISINLNYESESDFKEAIAIWKNKSIYDFNSDVSESDKIITLYTCDNNTNYRILIHAKLIPIE